MSTERDDGGPAFPCDQIIRRDQNGRLFGFEVSSPGMTLRDHFAAQVLPAAYESYIDTATGFPAQWRAEVAVEAYRLADEMLKARTL